MNLKPKSKISWHIFVSENFIAICIALVLVLLINQAVFSFILKNRENANATFISSGVADFDYNLASDEIMRGTNDVVLAEIGMPGALSDSSVTCNFNLADNPCIEMVDADGTATSGAGTDDDGALNLFKLTPLGPSTAKYGFQESEGVCANDLENPTCVYVDSDANCDPADGTQTYLVGSNCAVVRDQHPGNICADSWDDPTCVYIDSDANCDPADSTQTYLVGSDCASAAYSTMNFCANDLNNPTCVYENAGDTCDPAIGTQAYVFGSNCAAVYDKNVYRGSSFPHWWVHSELVNANGSYDYGNSAASTETIWILKHKADSVLKQSSYWNEAHSGEWQGDEAGAWIALGNINGDGYLDTNDNGYFDSDDAVIIDVDGNSIYSDGDIDVYGSGIGMEGQALLNLSTAVGQNGKNIIFTNTDGHGSGLDSSGHDTILEDVGDVQTGSDNNNYIDRLDNLDYIDRLSLKNFGTAEYGRDFTNMRVYADLLGIGIGSWNNYCDANDLLIDTLSYDEATDTYINDTPALSKVYAPGILTCVVADIPETASLGATIIPGIPQLYDANSNGLYDSGDRGAFYYSGNDGPVDSDLVLPYTLTIGPLSLRRGTPTRVADTTPPGQPTNVKVQADSTGTVTFTWQDPADDDLSQIVIDESGPEGNNSSVAEKGALTMTLTGRKPKAEYNYDIRARDRNDNLSADLLFAITIPEQGSTEKIVAGQTSAQSLPENINIGDVVKSDQSANLYYVGGDFQKHLFYNEAIYSSWYADFSQVKTISQENLDAIKIGSDMAVREGTYLVKNSKSPKIYAVAGDALLTWISSERILDEDYGKNWPNRLIILPDDMFKKYKIAAETVAIAHPNGSLISYKGGSKIYYIDSGFKREVSKEIFAKNNYQEKFVCKNIDPSLQYELSFNLGVKNTPVYLP